MTDDEMIEALANAESYEAISEIAAQIWDAGVKAGETNFIFRTQIDTGRRPAIRNPHREETP